MVPFNVRQDATRDVDVRCQPANGVFSQVIGVRLVRLPPAPVQVVHHRCRRLPDLEMPPNRSVGPRPDETKGPETARTFHRAVIPLDPWGVASDDVVVGFVRFPVALIVGWHVESLVAVPPRGA